MQIWDSRNMAWDRLREFRAAAGGLVALMLVAGWSMVEYQGAGRFVVQLPWPGWSESAATAAGPYSSRPILALGGRPAGSARIQGPGATAAAAAPRRGAVDGRQDECAVIRERLSVAVRRYRETTHRPMETLDIFALLTAKTLDELPACPSGGTYRLASVPQATVACTLH